MQKGLLPFGKLHILLPFKVEITWAGGKQALKGIYLSVLHCCTFNKVYIGK